MKAKICWQEDPVHGENYLKAWGLLVNIKKYIMSVSATFKSGRQTETKSHYRLICHRNERDICTCIYKIVSLLKSYDNIHGMTYTTKIMLSGIAKIKTGYFDNVNDYY